MSLSSISGKSFFYEKMNVGMKQQKSKKYAKNGFSGDLKEMAPKDQEEEISAKKEEKESCTSVQMDYSYGRVSSAIRIMQDGRLNMSAVLECAIRHISYSESDYVKTCVQEGYTLKAQVDAEKHMVYIEQKNEDGSSFAYEVNPLKVSKDTDDPIEQMAVEAWEKARDLFNDGVFTEINEESDMKEGEAEEEELLTFAKALADFHEYVKTRIKEGPPKIQIGGSEFSQKEWERLLRKIDKEIDAYKEELRERIRKLKEKSAVNQAAGSATEEKSLAETAGVEAGEETAKGPAVLESEAITGTKTQSQRGTSFLARLSGEKKAPYSYLADESGMIVYKGVTFVCDDKKQQICLGDMSNPNRVLNIPLSKGGTLRVNRDNLGDLVKAIDMFSPEDIARILKVIAQDKKIQDMEFEIEDLEAKGPLGGTQSVS